MAEGAQILAGRAPARRDIIAGDEREAWTEMLADRNLTSHVDREDVAGEVFERIRTRYVECFARTLERVRALTP